MLSSLDNSQVPVTLSVDVMKKRIQAEKFLDTILNFKPLVSSKQPFTRFIDLFVTSVNGLKSLQLDNLSEYILYSIAMRKLDLKTRGDFEAIVIHENMMSPSVSDLVQYIEKQRNYNQVVTECLQESRSSKCVNNQKVAADSASSSTSRNNEKINESFDKLDKASTNSKVSNDKVHNKRSKTNSKANLLSKRSSQGTSSPKKNHSPTNQNPSHHNKKFTSTLDDNHLSEPNSQSISSPKKNHSPHNHNKESTTALDNKVCFVCAKEAHSLNLCTVFNNSDPATCLNYIKNKKLCANCFGPNHIAFKCPDKSNCNLCRGKHHFKLHLSHFKQTTPNNADKSDEKTDKTQRPQSAVTSSSDDSHLITDKDTNKPNGVNLLFNKSHSPNNYNDVEK